MEVANTFGALSLPLTNVGENETIKKKIEISSSSSSTRNSFETETSLKTCIKVYKQFSAFSVEFTIQDPVTVETPTEDLSQESIELALMMKIKLRVRPTEKDLVKSNCASTTI